MLIVILVIFSIAAGAIPAMIADYKGYNVFLWWLFGATLLVVAFPMALALKSTAAALRMQERDRERDLTFRECPSCYQDIRREATECRFCHRNIMPTQIRFE